MLPNFLHCSSGRYHHIKRSASLLYATDTFIASHRYCCYCWYSGLIKISVSVQSDREFRWLIDWLTGCLVVDRHISFLVCQILLPSLLTLPSPILSYPVLFYPVPSFPNLPCPVLSCLMLSFTFRSTKFCTAFISSFLLILYYPFIFYPLLPLLPGYLWFALN